MHRFKVGQEVVAVRDNPTAPYKKGDEFIVDGLTCCPNCGLECVYLKGFYDLVNSECSKGCGFIDRATRDCFNQSNFAPKQSLSDAIEYRLSVSIKELEVKEYQQQ